MRSTPPSIVPITGILCSAVPVMVGEMAPSHLRGSCIAMFQLMVTIGMLCGFVVNLIFSSMDYGWRIALLLQCVPAIVLFVGMIGGVPESPRYLVKVGRIQEARQVLHKLNGTEYYMTNEAMRGKPCVDGNQEDKKDSASVVGVLHSASNPSVGGASPLSSSSSDNYVVGEVDDKIRDIQTELEQEHANKEDSIWKDWGRVFNRDNQCVMLVGVLVGVMQQIGGFNAFMYYSPSIFAQMCIPGYVFTVVNGVVFVVFTIVGQLLIDRVGRKPIIIAGTLQMMISCLVAAAILASVSDIPSNPWVGYFIGVLTFSVTAGFGYSWGIIAWVLMGEMFPLAMRGKGAGVGTSANMILTFCIALLTPIMMSSDSPLGTAGTYGVYGGLNLIFVLPFCIFLLPETGKMSLEDIHKVFDHSLACCGDAEEEEEEGKDFASFVVANFRESVRCASGNVVRSGDDIRQRRGGIKEGGSTTSNRLSSH